MADDDRTLYIGNIDRDVSEEILYELFLQAGPIDRVNIYSNKNDSFRYGFVTYKHEVSIDYAIQLFKGTALFRKELSIKKKGTKGNSGQLPNNFNTLSHCDSSQARQSQQGVQDNFQSNLLNIATHNILYNSQFMSNCNKVVWQGWNHPYNYGGRNFASRAREPRDRRQDRDYKNKIYHSRKNRHRD